jgi:PadR family transcriptional regulator, regulatory protein PadR
VMSI